ARPELDDGGAVAFGKPEQRERQADEVVIVPFGLEDAPAQSLAFKARLLENRRDHFFRRRLAVRARNGKHLRIKMYAPVLTERPERFERISDTHDCRVLRLREWNTLMDDQTSRAAARGVLRKAMTVEFPPLQRDKNRVRLDFLRVRHNLAESGAAPPHRQLPARR